MEIMTLKELGPELGFTQVMGDVLQILLPDGRVSAEDGIDDIRR